MAGETDVVNLLGLGTSCLVQSLSDTLSNDGVVSVSSGGDAMIRLLHDLASLFGGHDEMVRIAKV